ncbi:extracellular matrix/biofilm biosynthesis regulator RemA family protein [Bacillus sp. FJAT-47783]|uniref:extracellular matrix regulator RemB n=1 Tax=Bacillus sp. FJAT-47783 TaxID=2922712 RepID=UPI001FACEA85|nr:extracellular matrix/biofilm biosynthesis regulator RemA family protein [Bacillus sp. FJAT-47783]
MYIHIGDNPVVPSHQIVMIFDYKGAASTIMEEFLGKQKEKIVQLANGEVKSVIITDHDIFFSPLATSTLKKRAESFYI